MINHPKISVVIPAYNEEKYIARTLKSLKSQNYSKANYEIIVSDNNSSDETRNIAKDLGARVIRSSFQSVGHARNTGSEAAVGAIVAFIDSDTIVPDDWLSTIESSMKDPKIVCVGGLALPLEKSILKSIIFGIYDWSIKINQFLGKTLPWGFNLALKEDSLEGIGGFDASLKTSEDWDLALRLQKKYGRKSVVYNRKLKAYTSTRKQESLPVFIKYTLDGLKNYVRIVILGRHGSEEMINMR